MFSFCHSSSSGFSGAARNADQDLNKCLGQPAVNDYEPATTEQIEIKNFQAAATATAAAAAAAISANKTDARVSALAV